MLLMTYLHLVSRELCTTSNQSKKNQIYEAENRHQPNRRGKNDRCGGWRVRVLPGMLSVEERHCLQYQTSVHTHEMFSQTRRSPTAERPRWRGVKVESYWSRVVAGCGPYSALCSRSDTHCSHSWPLQTCVITLRARTKRSMKNTKISTV